MMFVDIARELERLEDLEDGGTFRRMQASLVRISGDAATPFWCFPTPANVRQVEHHWTSWTRARRNAPTRSRRFHLAPTEQRWLAEVVVPQLARDATEWVALPALFPERRSALVFWPRRSRRLLADLVTQLVGMDGGGLSRLAAGDAPAPDPAALRRTAIHLMHAHRDLANPVALARSLELGFPASTSFDRCFYLAQETLVGLLDDRGAPFFSVPSAEGRARAASFWGPRCERRPEPQPRHSTMAAWSERHGVDAYRVLAPVPRDPVARRERMTGFLLDVLTRPPAEAAARWRCDADLPAIAGLRYHAATAYARRHPDTRLVAALIHELPTEGAGAGWPRHAALGELQRSLVWLTAHADAPLALPGDVAAVNRAAGHWRAWWSEHADTFAPAPADQSALAVKRWERAGAGAWRRYRTRRRLAGFGAPLGGLFFGLAGLAGFGMMDLADAALRRRRSKARVPGFLWWPARILGLVVFVIGVGIAVLVWATPQVLLAAMLGLASVASPARWRRWLRGRRPPREANDYQ